MASKLPIIKHLDQHEPEPANDNGWGMVLRTNGIETKLSPAMARYVIDNLRTVQQDRLWMSEDGQDSIDNLTVLLFDHL